ncbi:hypothetical protein DKT68_21305 [Micromonospora acroterricola]|uniref:Uncharacterized protein n=1 Tax=Micromonospora acroterricola TaxID=2202421 RepID=A0A317CZ10_9ACTN|nr:hypothetical protein [Micromonospora acroterricola]PWR06786.1 hypothetical protein DKT68_21305 [Micromonospora acroterricola]
MVTTSDLTDDATSSNADEEFDMAGAGPTDLDMQVDRLEMARRIAREMIESDHQALELAVRQRPQCWSRRPVGHGARPDAKAH